MKTIRRVLICCALLGATAAAHAQVNMPNPQQPGNSLGSAVRLMATNDIMIDREITRWLRSHYPGWDADPHEIMELGTERYAVVYITAPQQPGRRIYFRLQRSPSDRDDDGPFPGM